MINKDTLLCMSLSGRPGNFGTRFHNSLYQQLGLNFIYKAFSTTNIEDAIKVYRYTIIKQQESQLLHDLIATTHSTEDKRQLANKLGISVSSLYRKMAEYKLAQKSD